MTAVEGRDLGPVLLYFYECLTDPDKLDTLMETLTSWLDDEGGTVVTPTLEDHADQAWRLLGQISEPKQPVVDVNDGLEHTYFKDRADLEQDILDKIRAEDLGALTGWLAVDDNAGALLLRMLEGRSTELVILSRAPLGDGFVVKRTGPEFHAVISKFFADSFELTQAELSLVEELLSGGSLRDIAGRLGKSWETTRSQVKTLTNKLGVKTQGDILRMVNQAATLMPPQKTNTAAQTVAGLRTLVRPDGRTLCYEVDGARTDKTLVYLHGLIEGRHWPEKARRLAVRNGWQVIRISRAGRGMSSVNPKEGAALLQDHVDDVMAIVNQENIDGFSIYGPADGFCVGYALSLQYPERVKKIVGLEVVPPILTRAAISGFSGKMKTYGLACLYAPKTIRFMLSLAMKKLDQTEDRYTTVHPLLGVNLSEIEDAEGIRCIEANFQDVMKHQAEGVWRDATLSGLDWADAPINANTRPRAALIHCENSLINSSDFLNDFAMRIAAPIYRFENYLPHVSAPLPLVLKALEEV